MTMRFCAFGYRHVVATPIAFLQNRSAALPEQIKRLEEDAKKPLILT